MGWNTREPIANLPARIAELFSCEAKSLLEELEQNRLTVVLADAPERKHTTHKIRVVENYNPDWYRDLYHYYRHFRRNLSEDSLRRISNGRDGKFASRHRWSPYKYDNLYRGLILERLTEGYVSDRWGRVPPVGKIKGFFSRNGYQ